MKDELLPSQMLMAAILNARASSVEALTQASMDLTKASLSAPGYEASQQAIQPEAFVNPPDLASVVSIEDSQALTRLLASDQDLGTVFQNFSAVGSGLNPVSMVPVADLNNPRIAAESAGATELVALDNFSAAGLPVTEIQTDFLKTEIGSGLKEIDAALYGDFRDFTYEIYRGIEAEGKSTGQLLDSTLEDSGLPLVGDVLDPFNEFQYVDTLSQGPSQITIFARSLIGDLVNADRSAYLPG